MLNELMFRKIFKAPEWKEVKPQGKRNNKKSNKPKDSTLAKVLCAIGAANGINRAAILTETKLTGHSVNRCINYLIKNDLITRIHTGWAGGYKTYDYYLIG